MIKFLHLQKEDKNALLTFLDARIAKNKLEQIPLSLEVFIG